LEIRTAIEQAERKSQQINFGGCEVKIAFMLTDNDGNRYEGTTELSPAWPAAGQAATESAEKEAPGSLEPKGLPDHILDLRSQGFFKEPRAPSEVHNHLLRTYHCELERVKVALLRLQRRRELRKTAKELAGQERVAYVW
jgi:hypothetical protein